MSVFIKKDTDKNLNAPENDIFILFVTSKFNYDLTVTHLYYNKTQLHT